MSNTSARIDTMNQACFCVPLQRAQIDAEIASGFAAHAGEGMRPVNIEPGLMPTLMPPLMPTLLDARPNLFAASGVFLDSHDWRLMLRAIAAIEAVTALPQFQQQVAARQPDLAPRLASATPGLFMGYDFHITPQGPKLIEINTNAGGAALVNAMQGAASVAAMSCGVETLLRPVPDFGLALADSLLGEWRAAGRSDKPQHIVIVDAKPAEEYLYPDMLLTQALLQAAGLNCSLASAADLHWHQAQLLLGDQPVDMVVNRLTDFMLTADANVALRQAWLAGAAVVSPAPEHHALFADKRNLALLSDTNHLGAWGLPPAQLEDLAVVPETKLVEPGLAEELWQQRKQWFFKPVSGFAGRGAYRGGKLTKRAWQDIQTGDYVAQRLVPPAYRIIAPPPPVEQPPAQQPKDGADATHQPLKYDLRIYTYAAQPLLLAARVYQGQTTNFRTPGGGFAPVFGCS